MHPSQEVQGSRASAAAILIHSPPPPLSSVGIYVIGFSFPVVPKGKARIRVQISAAHTEQDIDRCVEAFVQTGRKHGVVS